MRARAEERRLVKITRQEAAAAAAEEEEPTGAAVQQTPGKANRCEFGCGSTATAVPLSSALSSSHFLPHAPTAHHFSASASYSSSPSPAHTSSSSGACRSDTVSVRWVSLGGTTEVAGSEVVIQRCIVRGKCDWPAAPNFPI